jgi:ankyrin repeat protein
MTPSRAAEASTAVQADAFLLDDERYERVYRRREATLRHRLDAANDRLLPLSDDKPWQVFGCRSRLQRRRLVFEHRHAFPDLHEACAAGDRERVRILLRAPGVCVLDRDACGRIALHHAVVTENVKSAKRLLRRRDARLQVHAQDNSSRTALHYALEKMEVLALHRRGGCRAPALVTAEMRGENRRYRRLWELADGMLEMFSRSVLEGERCVDGESLRELDLRCRGDAWDVCRSGDVRRLETVIEVYGCSEGGWELKELKRTLLHEACENQQLGVVHLLLSTMSVSVLAQDTSGCTALHCAARRGFLDVCAMLLGTPASDRSDEGFQLEDSAEELALLQDVRGRTALHWCLLGSCGPSEKKKVAACLAQACPAALHVCDHDGISPLHVAVWKGELALVQQFIGLGASVCGPLGSVRRARAEEKAPWAPCGVVFQRRRQHSQHDTTRADAPVPSACLSPSGSRRRAPDWEAVQHPVEAAWYWAQHLGGRTSKAEAVDATIEAHREGDPVGTEDALGCQKYGGTCDRCKLPDTNGMTRPQPPASNDYPCRQLSPLLLALRVCALKGGSGAQLAHRAAIVELLLSNGAPPDGDAADSEESSQCVSALREGVRAALRCPHILPMLLQLGATRLDPRDVVRWRSSVASADARQAQAVLTQLLALENVAASAAFLTMLFQEKCFFAMCALMQRPRTAQDGFQVGQGFDCSSAAFSPWKCIHDSLLAWRKRRKAAGDSRAIGIEHLAFLRGFLQATDDTAATGLRASSSLYDLFEYCVGLFLQQRWQDRKGTRGSTALHQEVVFESLCILFRHWGVADQRVAAKAAAWLEPVATLGYFDCALVLLERLHQLNRGGTLLDTVFELHAASLGARQGCAPHHREFLLVCAEKLLAVDSTAAEIEQPQLIPAHSSALASLRSFVHSCAQNLPVAIVKSCFAIVFPDGVPCVSPDTTKTLATLTKLRVGGKTVYEWIVLHTRSDIMRWLVAGRAEGSERGSCWRRFAAASTVLFSRTSDGGSRTSSSFVEDLFVVYADHVQNHLSASERADLLVDLMVNCAIPADCVVLLTRLMERCIDQANGEPIEPPALKEARVPYWIARWNAVKIAAFCLSGRHSSDGVGINRVAWRQILVDRIHERHERDECTALELCRLLGHNGLYQLLSSSLQDDSLPQAKPVLETEADACQSSANSDADEEATEPWPIGLLRSVLEINENVTATSTELGDSVASFRGYQRHDSVQNPWVAAVTLNQVSLLQAMALARPPRANSSPSVCALVLAAIKSGSLGALQWILESSAPVAKHLSDQEAIECLSAAAKHPGDVYAEMTLLLLERHLSPGRLAGDGMGVPLLHRAACFSKPSLACRTMTMLLERSDCDVNALDAFGNTAVSYALAAGCLSNACFLIQHAKCRLEAEYEGQASFYYVLHTLPSFASRTIVRELLVAKRDRAFLHCEAEAKSCGCKGYENAPGVTAKDGALPALCSFCGHESASHRLVPLPSWFRDQYDTYSAARNSPRKRYHSSSDEGDDSDSEASPDQFEESSQDEETALENARGRLDVQRLMRITALRYDDVLHVNGLSLADASQQPEHAALSVDNPATRSDPSSDDSCGPATQNEPEGETPACVTMEDLAPVDGVAPGQRVALHGERIGATRTRLTHCPWWLQQELAMVHSPRCHCQATALVTRPSQLVHVAVCRWLRRLAVGQMRQHATVNEGLNSLCSDSVTETAIVALASMQTAFESWRKAARLTDSLPAKAVPKSPAPLPRILSSVLFHWRHGKAFLAFQRWKHLQKSAEVAHHRLATRLEQVAADMRRHRFTTLQARQQQLQDATRSLQPH